MKLSDTFWKTYELDLQEVKISYLNWAITQAKEPGRRFRNLFLWNHQREFCIVNSRYGRAFAISPFGIGVRAVPKSQSDGRRDRNPHTIPTQATNQNKKGLAAIS